MDFEHFTWHIEQLDSLSVVCILRINTSRRRNNTFCLYYVILIIYFENFIFNNNCNNNKKKSIYFLSLYKRAKLDYGFAHPSHRSGEAFTSRKASMHSHTSQCNTLMHLPFHPSFNNNCPTLFIYFFSQKL